MCMTSQNPSINLLEFWNVCIFKPPKWWNLRHTDFLYLQLSHQQSRLLLHLLKEMISTVAGSWTERGKSTVMPAVLWRKFSGQSMVGIKAGFWAQRPGSRRYPPGGTLGAQVESRGANLELSSAHEGLLKARQEDSQGPLQCARAHHAMLTLFNILWKTELLKVWTWGGRKAASEKTGCALTHYRIMPGIHIDSEWSMQSSSLRNPRGETQVDAWIHDSLQNESEKNTRAQEDHREITGELWWISELNSIINHSRGKKKSAWEAGKNNHVTNKLNNNCISFPHQKTQSAQAWIDWLICICWPSEPKKHWPEDSSTKSARKRGFHSWFS